MSTSYCGKFFKDGRSRRGEVTLFFFFLIIPTSADVAFHIGFTLLLPDFKMLSILMIFFSLVPALPPSSIKRAHTCMPSTSLAFLQHFYSASLFFYFQSIFVSLSHSISSFQLLPFFVPFLSLDWLFSLSLHSACFSLPASDFHLFSFLFPSLSCCNVSTPSVSHTEHHTNSFHP